MSLYGGIELTGRPSLENVRKLDLLAMPMISRMHQYGIAINREYFAELSENLSDRMNSLKGDICSYIPEEKLAEFVMRSKLPDDDYSPMNVNSRDQLSTLLFDVLKIGHDRQLKTTKSGKRISTGKKQLEAIKQVHPVIPITLLYAEIHKLKSTYSDKLPKLAKFHPDGPCWCGLRHQAETWRVHTEILTTRTSTGRLASKNPNLQNTPARSELGRMVRKGFIASPGTQLVSCDYSQEEMRFGAHHSGDKNLIRIFELGLDPHNETAKIAFNTDKPDYLTQRTPSRNVNFGVFYGLSGPGLYDMMAITYATANLPLPETLPDNLGDALPLMDWCDWFVRFWFTDIYSGVKKYLETQIYRARRYGLVWTLMGRIRRVPEIRSCHRHVQSAGLRQAVNMPIQGDGADVMRLTMGEVEEKLLEVLNEGIWVWPLLTVHDDLVVEAEDKYAEFVRDLNSSVMSSVLTDRETGIHQLRVPLMVDGKVMTEWKK